MFLQVRTSSSLVTVAWYIPYRGIPGSNSVTLDGGHIKHPSEGSNVHSNGTADGPDYLLVRIRNFSLDVKIRQGDGTEAQPSYGYSAVEVFDPWHSRHNQGCTKQARILENDFDFQVLPQILQLDVGVGLCLGQL